VRDTATLWIGDQSVPLFGITGETGELADQLQQFIDSQGGQVTCERRERAYSCVLPSGVDIARAALINGAARPAADAPDDFLAQARTARAQHRGIWK
jgi:endonuclease YncB( thermonuclease family)